MPLRLFNILFPLFLVLTGCRGNTAETSTPSPAVSPHPPHHVFFITVDTLRADHMSLYGYPRATTPNLQKLAATGVTFDRAITQWPKTGSSFAAMFTGLYPHHENEVPADSIGISFASSRSAGHPSRISVAYDPDKRRSGIFLG